MDKRVLEKKGFHIAATLSERWLRLIRSERAAQVRGMAQRFLLCAVLGRGLIFGTYAPMGTAMVAACAVTGEGYSAVLGAFLGALMLRGGLSGVTAAAAAMLTLASIHILRGRRRRLWLAPVTSAAATALCSGVLLPASDQLRAAHLFQFALMVVLTGVLAWCGVQALSPPRGKSDVRRPASLLVLTACLLVSVADLSVFGLVAPARILAYALVMGAAYLGGSTAGAAIGVAFGVTMDAAAGQGGFLTCIYGLSALLSGAFHHLGKAAFTAAALLSGGCAALLGLDHPLFLSSVYECLFAAMLFAAIPDSIWQYARDSLLPAKTDAAETVQRVRRAAGKYAVEASEAFYEMYLAMMSGMEHGKVAADDDVHMIFDRAADKVCRRCVICSNCWQKDYVSTLSALSDVSIPMLRRGRAEASDFPRHFADRCLHFPELIYALNEALYAMRERRQYRQRCDENRSLIAQQYAGLTGILRQIGGNLGKDQASLPARERQVQRYASAFGRVDKVAVFRDGSGRLRVELSGEGTEQILAESRGFAAGLSALLQVGLSDPVRVSDELGTRLMLREQAPFRVVVGLGQRQKDGEKVSGDTGRSFVTEEGQACVLLADGMGTGEAAAADSRRILSMMERFLRAGIGASDALRTVAPAFRLRCDGMRGVTLDVLTLDLFTGRGECLKCGAAPSYIQSASAITRLSGGTLPVGLSDEPAAKQSVPVRLTHGDLFIMVSDGVCDGTDDGWLRALIEERAGDSPKELAARLVMAAADRGASDDMTAMVVRLERRQIDRAETV